MLRGLVTFVIIILGIILQSTFLKFISINNISFNLLLIIVASYGIIRGNAEGAIVGFLIGFLQDVFFGSVIGLYALLYMYIGFFTGYFNRSYYRDRVLLPIMIIAGADLILNLAIYLFTYLFRGRTALGVYLTKIILPEITYTVLASIIVYRLFILLNYYLNRYEDWKRGKDLV